MLKIHVTVLYRQPTIGRIIDGATSVDIIESRDYNGRVTKVSNADIVVRPT